MKTIRKYLLLIVAMSVVFSCNSTKVTKRYKKASLETTPNIDNYVNVQAFAFDVKGVKTSKTIFDLSPRGQEALVEEIAKKEGTSKAIYNQLSKQFIMSSSPVTHVDKTKFKKRLVFSVEDLKNYNGANRLDWIKIKVKIPTTLQNELRFVYWDKIITEHQEIDLGKISFSRVNSSSIDPSIGFDTGIVNIGIAGNVSTSETISEELQLKQKFAKIYGSLSESELYIAMQSAPLQNLSGNIVLELNFEAIGTTAPEAFYDFQTKDPTGNDITDGSKVAVKKTIYQHSSLNYATSDLELTYEARYRMVERGARTSIEGDDVIKMLNGAKSIATKFKLFDREDLVRKVWFIEYNGISKLALKNKVNGNVETIRFNSYEKAKKFLWWLYHNNLTTVKGYDICKDPINVLTTGDISNLSIIVNSY